MFRMPATLDPGLLATFLAVLEHGRISAAARAEHLSQPAVTGRIRRLERELGAALFTRSVHGVTPTAAGARLAVHARAHRRLLAEAAADVGGAALERGELALAASTTIAAHALPPVLARFRARMPAARLVLAIGNSEDVVARLRAGKAALGLVEGLPRASGVRFEPWRDDELVPVLGRDAPWSPRRIEDLATLPLLWREPGSGTRAVVARALARAGARNRPGPLDLELASNEAIAGAAAAGLGLAFLSRAALGPHLAAGHLRPVPGLGLLVRRTFSWALPSGGLAGLALTFRRLADETPGA